MKKLFYTIVGCFMILGTMVSCDSNKQSSDAVNDSDSIVVDTLVVETDSIVEFNDSI